MSSPRNWKQDPRLNDHGYLWQLMSPDELADEVMALRAQLQAMANERHVQYTLAQKYKAECAELMDSEYKRGWNDGWDAATEAHTGDQPL